VLLRHFLSFICILDRSTNSVTYATLLNHSKKVYTNYNTELLYEKLVGGLAIREATAEVVNRGCHHSESCRVPFHYGGPSLWWPFAIADPNPTGGRCDAAVQVW